MNEPEHPIAEVAAREEFFTQRRDDIAARFAEASAGFDWTTEPSPLDAVRRALPSALGEEIPDAVRLHFKAAQHELLIAFRTLLDHWIERTAPEDKPAASRRERIRIEGSETKS
jgi:hypothetical protein